MKIGLNRKVINIEVCDKVFKIGIFPIMCDQLIVKNDIIEKEWEKQESPTTEDLAKKNRAQHEIQFELLETLLVANGYEFDKEWWQKHVDLLGIQEFIVIAKSKDVMKDVKKKEVVKSH